MVLGNGVISTDIFWISNSQLEVNLVLVCSKNLGTREKNSTLLVIALIAMQRINKT
jgi:hypothetical protein